MYVRCGVQKWCTLYDGLIQIKRYIFSYFCYENHKQGTILVSCVMFGALIKADMFSNSPQERPGEKLFQRKIILKWSHVIFPPLDGK